MKNRIYNTDVANGIARPTNVDELWARVVQVWNQIPAATIQRIRTSYNVNRIQKVIDVNGQRFENEHIWMLMLKYEL